MAVQASHSSPARAWMLGSPRRRRHRAIPGASRTVPWHPREKPASRRGRAKSRETRTLRWREMDSNHRYPEDKLPASRRTEPGQQRLVNPSVAQYSGDALAVQRAQPRENIELGRRSTGHHGRRRGPQGARGGGDTTERQKRSASKSRGGRARIQYRITPKDEPRSTRSSSGMTPWQPSLRSMAAGLRAAVWPGSGPNSPGHAFRGELSGGRIYAERTSVAQTCGGAISNTP